MKKTSLIVAFLFISIVSYCQTMICWREEITERNPKTGQFEAKHRTDMNSEAFFGSDIIRINDVSIFLTKRKVISKENSENGIVTVFDVVTKEGIGMIAVVAEDRNGIFKLLISNPKNDLGLVYYIKNK